jgi:hypothetical protein
MASAAATVAASAHHVDATQASGAGRTDVARSDASLRDVGDVEGEASTTAQRPSVRWDEGTQRWVAGVRFPDGSRRQVERTDRADAERDLAELLAQLAEEAVTEPEQQQEWLLQSNLVCGALAVTGVVMVQPFLTAPALDPPARICVVAFAVAVPLPCWPRC